ncbi:MAG TPA: glycosyltransferase family 4 protein [Kineosporiaceae bacterium]|nr:glycosyltransferase family 4 protein [Kineosporiaceae bacterium]
MRIGHISDCYLPRLGGIEMQVHDLAVHQRAAGHDVTVITATPRARHDRTSFELVDGVPVRRVTADLPFELPVHPRTGREISRLLATQEFDVVHLHAGLVSPFAYAAAPVVVRAGLPVVITVHSLWGSTRPAFTLLDRWQGWSRWPIVLSAVSDVAAAPIRRVAGPDCEVEVLPNGIDATAWRLDPLPRDAQDVHLVAVMRLAPRKRPLPLLRILREVRRLVPARIRLTATIVGEGPQRPAMERYLARHGLDRWVDLPGRYTRDQIHDLYRRSDVFVAPAVLESFGIAALEARCAGLPVAAMANTGIREFVGHGVEGLLASSDADLAAALARLARSPQLRGEISVHNRTQLPPVTWDDVLARSEACYKRAAGLLR